MNRDPISIRAGTHHDRRRRENFELQHGGVRVCRLRASARRGDLAARARNEVSDWVAKLFHGGSSKSGLDAAGAHHAPSRSARTRRIPRCQQSQSQPGRCRKPKPAPISSTSAPSPRTSRPGLSMLREKNGFIVSLSGRLAQVVQSRVEVRQVIHLHRADFFQGIAISSHGASTGKKRDLRRQ